MSKSFALALPVLLSALAACGGQSGGSGVEAVVASVARSEDGRVQRLRAALGTGRGEQVAELLPMVEALGLGTEWPLLQARFAALRGAEVEAARLVEVGRASDPLDPRVYATAAEIAVIGERLDLARAELATGIRECGLGPELMRARGVIAISTPGDLGAARRGLVDLEAAREMDPTLPFLDWPQSEAYRLVGQALCASDPELAESHLRQSLELNRDNLYAAESLGELLVTQARWDEGLSLLHELVERGEAIHAKLAGYEKSAAMGCLLAGQKEQALEHLVRARDLGMPPAQLRSGTSILIEATKAAMSRGNQALEAGEGALAEEQFELALRYDPGNEAVTQALGLARASLLVEEGVSMQREERHHEALLVFERALEQDPESLQAHVFLGASHFAIGHYTKAAEAWAWAVDTARSEDLVFPEPLHLQLAQALLLAGEKQSAHSVLGAYLEHEPEGSWARDTREFLNQVDGRD